MSHLLNASPFEMVSLWIVLGIAVLGLLYALLLRRQVMRFDTGTSGMKAAVNGVLNFSVLDGWWREAYNGENGWAIGPDADLDDQVQDQTDAESLYQTLENEIIPLYYNERDANDVNRVNALIPPNVVNQFRVFAGKVQFVL